MKLKIHTHMVTFRETDEYKGKEAFIFPFFLSILLEFSYLFPDITYIFLDILSWQRNHDLYFLTVVFYSFIQKYLLSNYYILDTVIVAGIITVNKINRVHVLMDFPSCWGSRKINI